MGKGKEKTEERGEMEGKERRKGREREKRMGRERGWERMVAGTSCPSCNMKIILTPLTIAKSD